MALIEPAEASILQPHHGSAKRDHRAGVGQFRTADDHGHGDLAGITVLGVTGNSAPTSLKTDAWTVAQLPVVTLTASLVETTTATLTISGHGESWWLKRTTPADTTCKSKAVPFSLLESLTALSPNTSYTYKAYSDSGCNTELADQASAFLTKPGTPDHAYRSCRVRAAGKLTISSSVTGSGTLSKWQYKKKEGTGNFDAMTGRTITLDHHLPELHDHRPGPTARTTSSRCVR